MANSFSPLRYPGGKSKIYDRVKNLIELNSLGNRNYIEPFAGGFGIGIRLLCDNIVQNVLLNDYDSHIYHFWYSVINNTDDLLKKIIDTPITLDERGKQISIYNNNSDDILGDGFATLFLNRVNYSGIINGGPIGGFSQHGIYKIDCRFNKIEIVNKIKRIAMLKERIFIFNYDAIDLIVNRIGDIKATSFFNIDPPYVIKGNRLYTNYFKEEDHKNFGEIITKHINNIPWIITYDDCQLIREIYKLYHIMEYSIQHNAGGSAKRTELVITNFQYNNNLKFVW